MSAIRELPEIAGLNSRRSMVRIPPEVDVPLTPRVRRLIDTPAFRRLARISQLGLVALVYPAAIHTRLEHSLGVYRLALLYLQQLSHDPRFAAAIATADAELLLAGALLHDLGHWPFCHPIEDMRLRGVPRHEELAKSFLAQGEIADLLRIEWRIEPADLIGLLSESPGDTRGRILQSLLSGPIDVDKMDYLGRDSLHAGVPYGRNFDQQRLIGSLCLNAAGDGLAITDKGKTAAEMMVFARYVMFSEVYWHHGVRAATAMLQRAFFLLHDRLDLDRLFRLTEAEWIAEMQRAAVERQAAGPAGAVSAGPISPATELLDGLFGTARRLYKRLAHYSFFDQPEIYGRMARQPYPWLAACSEHLARLAAEALGTPIASHEILIDAPPVEREVEFNVEIHFAKDDRYCRLDAVSPVVRTLAKEQFDDYVKQVRLFAHPRVAAKLKRLNNFTELLFGAIDRTERG
jgi:hypothetical protein